MRSKQTAPSPSKPEHPTGAENVGPQVGEVEDAAPSCVSPSAEVESEDVFCPDCRELKGQLQQDFCCTTAGNNKIYGCTYANDLQRQSSHLFHVAPVKAQQHLSLFSRWESDWCLQTVFFFLLLEICCSSKSWEAAC